MAVHPLKVQEALLEVQDFPYPIWTLDTQETVHPLEDQEASLEVQEAYLAAQEASLEVPEVSLEVPEAFRQLEFPRAVPALVVGARVLA